MVAGDTESVKVLIAAVGVIIVMGIMSSSIVNMFQGGKSNIIQKWVNENLGQRVSKLCKDKDPDHDSGWYPSGNVSRSFNVDKFRVSKTTHDTWNKKTTTWYLQGYKDQNLVWEAKVAAASGDLASGLVGLLPGNDGKGPCEGFELVAHDNADEGSGRKFMSLKENDVPNSQELGDDRDLGGPDDGNGKDEIELHMWDPG